MQRPRRTSEFQDDSSCVRRQSRTLQRNVLAPSPLGSSGMVAACTSGTAKKSRQSRIAVPSRPSSNDRPVNTYLAGISSSVKRGFTPPPTPRPKTTASRVLFTAEKQRTGQGGNCVQLHNDKKWVHEQTQRITDHLLSQSNLGGGISTEFLNRGLRQMSIKQFVAIINYFLGYIWGNRFTVGSNHVEDITNILQKLQYPHQINKSWLKTPNTQHSFGNVIVLLDFLMDFVPPSENQNENEMYFDLKEPNELSASEINDDSFQVPNLEFQQELLRNSEKGFMLWDKQRHEEFNSLKEHTCNFLIQEKCGLANLEAIEMEINKLQEILKSIENERPIEDKEMQKKKSKLSRELKTLRQEIKKLQDECEMNDRDIKELGFQKMATIKKVETIEMDIKSLQATLDAQSCTIEQRDQMIANVVQYKQITAIKERAIQDLQNRYHNAQISQSKTIKQLNEQIESFNTYMREIKFSVLNKMDSNSSLNEDNLELSLRPQQRDLDKLISKLDEINIRALETTQKNKQELFQLREHNKKLTDNINVKLCPKLNALRAANTSIADNLQKLSEADKKEERELLKAIENIDKDLIASEATFNKLQSLIRNKKKMIEELIQANEQTMQQAEEKHHQCLEQRKAFLKAYDEMLEECMENDALQQLTERVQLQEKQLEDLRKAFDN